ncbi:MAG: CTP-dependent riboflavin kinase [Candidatus Tectomicrobia bacterium]|nr:CTP-dependent riboflavin kinase [Candidatus Tectomicrobia bacterium]
MGEDVIVRGTITLGLGEAVKFTQIDWVQEQCEEKFGFRPYPGTLNLRVRGEHLERWRRLRNAAGVLVVPPNAEFCNSKGFPVHIGSVRGAVIFPMVAGYPEDVIEIMAPVHLKETQGWSDGECVSVTFVGE